MADTNAGLERALGQVVLHKVDAEKGEGVELSEAFSVDSYPTFLLFDGEARIIDRWAGFDGAERFVETLRASLADPTTLEEKLARFASSPTAADAAKLGRIRSAQGDPAEAVRFYREARRLDGSSGAYALEIFENQVDGLSESSFTLDEVKVSADEVFERRAPRPEELVVVARTMVRVAGSKKDPSLATPYLGPALEASASATDEGLQNDRRALLIFEALHVRNDPVRAVELKRESMAEGWQEDPSGLNEFAWWCFENEVNLDQAETLARRGVELASEGSERAMILDTLAEIRNARGAPDDAAELIAQAIEQDPDNEYYREQHARFKAIQGVKS